MFYLYRSLKREGSHTEWGGQEGLLKGRIGA